MLFCTFKIHTKTSPSSWIQNRQPPNNADQQRSLESLPAAFNDALLDATLAPHASTLRALSVTHCGGVTWRGVEGLKTLTRLRRLRLAQQWEVRVPHCIYRHRIHAIWM